MDKKSGWEVMSEKELSEVEKFAEEYMEFMSENKTEREFVRASMEIAEQWGLSYSVFHGKTLGVFRPRVILLKKDSGSLPHMWMHPGLT